MRLRAAKLALAMVAALAALLPTDSAQAQRGRSPRNAYSAPNRSGQRSISDPRFTAEEQRIIDSISRNGWSTGP
jgi:hypothetical protein